MNKQTAVSMHSAHKYQFRSNAIDRIALSPQALSSSIVFNDYFIAEAFNVSMNKRLYQFVDNANSETKSREGKAWLDALQLPKTPRTEHAF